MHHHAFDSPDFYIEITSDKFNCPSNDVYNQEYLHEDWNTQHVYRIHPCSSGVYLLYDLHKNPHYHLHKSERDAFNSKASQQKVPIVNVCDPIFSVDKEIHFVSNEANVFKENIQPLIKEIDITSIINLLDSKDVCKRGNIAYNVGWHTLSFQFQGQINIPTHSNISKLDSDTFMFLTKCLHTSFRSNINPYPYSTNKKRSLEFANELVRFHVKNQRQFNDSIYNVFESMTYAMTYLSEPSNLLQPHVDTLNCSEQGFNAVFGIFFITEHPKKKNQYIRLVILGYSRKSINDYYNRLNKRSLFKSHLLRYYDLLKERQHLTIRNAYQFSKSDMKEANIIQKLPFVDKCGFYSIFVSCLYDLIQVHSDVLCLDHIVELVLPVGWLTTGVHYYKVIKNLECSGLPSTNLTVKIINDLLQFGRTISSGTGSRMQPYANKGVTSNELFNSLKVLKKTITHINRSGCQDYMTILKEVTDGMKFVGFIGAQHILAVLTLLGIIHLPMFARNALLLSKSNTEKRIKKFYSLSPKLVNVLYKEISNELFNGSTRLVENLVCEYFRDIKDPLADWNENTYNVSIKSRCKGTIRYPDTFISNQSIFLEIDNVIKRYYYDSMGNVKSMMINKVTLNETQVLDWNVRVSSPIYIPFVKCAKTKVSLKRENDSNITQTLPSSKRYKVPCSTSDSFMDTEGYHNIQYQVLKMLKKMKDPHRITKFEFQNKWFNGNIHSFNSIQTFQTIICPNRKKSKRSKKKLIQFSSLSDNSNGTFYTAFSHGTNKVIYLSSNSSNIYLPGFYRWYPNIFSSKKRDLFAYYETKEQAKMALLIKGFVDDAKNNITNTGNLSHLLKSDENSMIALFEKCNNVDYMFFGILSKTSNETMFLIPIDRENELWLPWQVFKVKT